MSRNAAESRARAEFQALPGVSCETSERIEAYITYLQRWQRRMNLVAPSTLDHVWSRHIMDSAQLFSLHPEARRWLDLGSGAGLPGIVLACLLRGGMGQIDLVESNRRKAAFLRHVVEALDLPVRIHAARIEVVLGDLPMPEIVTARALAPLAELFGYTKELLKNGVIGLFPKGRDHETELTEAGRHWQFSYALHHSRTERDARIIEITAFHGLRPG